MTYRKITVDGKLHEYVIGKDTVKFRGGPAIPFHALFGSTTVTQRNNIQHEIDERRFAVTPKNIATYLRNQP